MFKNIHNLKTGRGESFKHAEQWGKLALDGGNKMEMGGKAKLFFGRDTSMFTRRGPCRTCKQEEKSLKM